jgi:hypothetical protein
MSKPTLKLDWCSYEATKYACVHWHYSKSVPAGKLVKIGVWEDDAYIGTILFGRGATPMIGSPYGLPQTEICELVRVALNTHATPVSRIMSIAIRMLRKQSQGLRLIVSYADAGHNHHGGIYQASGYIYAGGCNTHAYCVCGEVVHPKTLHARYGKGGQSIPWLKANVDPNAARIVSGFKHRYLMPLDDAMRAQIAPLAKPYPKRARSADSGTPVNQTGGGGATPTLALSPNT